MPSTVPIPQIVTDKQDALRTQPDRKIVLIRPAAPESFGAEKRMPRHPLSCVITRQVMLTRHERGDTVELGRTPAFRDRAAIAEDDPPLADKRAGAEGNTLFRHVCKLQRTVARPCRISALCDFFD